MGITSGWTQTNNCGDVSAYKSCTIYVQFSPTTLGPQRGTLQWTDNTGYIQANSESVSLSGTGVTIVAGVAPTSLNFDDQPVGTYSAYQPVTLRNTGNAPMTINGISASSGFSHTTNCTTTLAAGGSCTINVTFKPTTTGPLTGTLTIKDNNHGVEFSPQTVKLSGFGGTIVAGVSPTGLIFPAQKIGTLSAPQPVTLRNTGTAPLTINGIKASGDFSHTTNCPSSLAAGGSCAIKVAFKPTATGTRTATLKITDNNQGVNNSTQTVSLSGTGTN
jgi:hypothetical protein